MNVSLSNVDYEIFMIFSVQVSFIMNRYLIIIVCFLSVCYRVSNMSREISCIVCIKKRQLIHLGEEGLKTFIDSSIARKDGFDSRVVRDGDNFIHKKCRTKYTNAWYIKKSLSVIEDEGSDDVHSHSSDQPRCSSLASTVNILTSDIIPSLVSVADTSGMHGENTSKISRSSFHVGLRVVLFVLNN